VIDHSHVPSRRNGSEANPLIPTARAAATSTASKLAAAPPVLMSLNSKLMLNWID